MTNQMSLFEGAPLKRIYLKNAGKKCSETDCDRLAFARGMCSKHYAYKRRNGWLESRPKTATCERCGDQIDVKPLGLLPKFCEPCRYLYKQRRIVLRKYGITSDEYDALTELQSGVCGICFGDANHGASRNRGFLSIDHNHKTGSVRGLLCSNCNLALGLFRDSAETLTRAAWWVTEGGVTGAS